VATGDVNLAWCVTDASLLDSAAPALPPVLRPEAAQELAALGMTSCQPPSTSQVGAGQKKGHEEGASAHERVVQEQPVHAAAHAGTSACMQPRQHEGAAMDDCALEGCLAAAAAAGAHMHADVVLESPQQGAVESSANADTAPPAAPVTLQRLLHSAFGLQQFRAFQLPVITRLLQVRHECAVAHASRARALRSMHADRARRAGRGMHARAADGSGQEPVLPAAGAAAARACAGGEPTDGACA
jgi:hypothetical protein